MRILCKRSTHFEFVKWGKTEDYKEEKGGKQKKENGPRGFLENVHRLLPRRARACCHGDAQAPRRVLAMIRRPPFDVLPSPRFSLEPRASLSSLSAVWSPEP